MQARDKASEPAAVRVACEGSGVIEIDQLHELQGELKSLSKEAFGMLRDEVLWTGFAFPFFVWRDPADQKLWIIGGHQRKRVLTELRREGKEVPPMPYVLVEAEDVAAAKRRVLQDVSQYGRVEYQGLYEFMSSFEMSPGDLAGSFVLPDIDLPSFNAEFFHDDVGGASDRASGDAGGDGGGREGGDGATKGRQGATEHERDEFGEFKHSCPRCGFHFD